MSLHAILSMQDAQNSLFLLIQKVNYGLGIILSSSGKDVNVEYLTHCIQKLKTVRSYIEFKLIPLESEFDISFFIGKYRMYQSLIKVENEKFLL